VEKWPDPWRITILKSADLQETIGTSNLLQGDFNRIQRNDLAMIGS
jgi:hypothetical protein